MAGAHQRGPTGLEPRIPCCGGLCTSEGHTDRRGHQRGANLKTELETVYSQQQLAKSVRSMGRAISRDYEGKTVDV